MTGTKISEATLREQLKGTENIPIVDTDLPKGRTTVEKLKEYIGAGGVGEDVSGKEFTIDGEQVTAQSGAEVFNKGTGNTNIAVGASSHAEGQGTQASGVCSHAEGVGTKALGAESHAEGAGAIAQGNYSHAEGNSTTASGENSHAEGYYTTVEQNASSGHAEGDHTTVSGTAAHAEGGGTQAKGNYSHAEGYYTTVEQNASSGHAEGDHTTVSGTAAHAEGGYTKANGAYSHAEGYHTETAEGSGPSHAEGNYTKTTNVVEHAEGNYNKSNTGGDLSAQTLHSIGIGTSENDRKNAFEVMYNGDAYLYGAGGYDGTNPGDEGVKTVQTQLNEIGGKMDKAGGEFTGTIAAPIVAFMRESQGMMGAIQADSNNILFRTYNAGVDSITFQVQSSMPLKLTEGGIQENGIPLENKYALLTDLDDLATKTEVQAKLDTNTYNQDKSTFATKTELSAKVGGTGVTAIKVVSALPDPQDDGVLYIVTGEEV